MWFESNTLALYVLFRVFCCVVGGFDDQAKILATNGHIIIESAQDRNITFYMKGSGHLNIGGLSVEQVLRTLSKMMIDGRSSTDSQAFLPGGSVAEQVQLLATYVSGPFGLIKRVESLEQESSTRNTTQMNPRIGALARRVKNVETKLATLMTTLQTNRCTSGPCQNGGTCIAQYDSFVCLCPSNWEGQTCTTDVNECALFAGTDLGCQNGATCKNVHGGYNCMCADGWRGIHCNTRSQDCATAGADLCGHGTCVQAKDGYRCICDQGWKTNGLTPACSQDVDECSESKPHCSKDPEVSCINLPGSFVCGPCPAGYTGNGFYCVDIDECETNNGGCSTSPSVPCINTRGSYRCGNCPAGYTGDGRTCLAQGNRCTQGLCHPMARCVDYGSAVPNCICLPGYTGSGFGPNGCYRSSMNPCASAPCRNGGTCVKIDAQNYSCTCPPDTNPPNCLRTTSPCEINPCQNGGTCMSSGGSFGRIACRCPPGYTGLRCQTQVRACGGIRYQLNGTLRYPEFNGTYNHNARCAWLIKTNDTQVLDITFTQFSLENPVSSGECKYDWLQIHDGRTSAAQIIGRFCGNELPRGGNFQSTHNMLYLWFRSDNSTAHDGFELQWKSVDPVCGGTLTIVSHGIITSPGTPGNYPPNRDCKWYLQAPQGRRIQFTFFTMKIEVHENCNYDFVQITDGPSDDAMVLAKYCNTTHPPPLITPSNEATVYFHSDESGNDAGFQIGYAVVEGVPGCGGTYTQREGVISSPLSQTDNVYPNNLNCEYLIKLPVGSRVNIKFSKFHLEQSEACKFDSLEIFDGSSTEDASLGKFCGDRIPPTFTSTGNSLLLKFHTDWSAPNPGFTLVYKIKCGGTFTDPETELVSPSYPQMYLADQLCDYVIQGPLGKAIKFDFQDFDIEKNSFPKCELDYVELYDGLLPTNDTLLGRYCSTKTPPTTIATKNVMLLRFVSDGSVAGRGFKGNFSFYDVSCGGVLMREDTIIRSPMIAESGKYQHDAQCEWIIVAPAGHAIQLTWNSFELEVSGRCVYDYVQVFDNSTYGNSLVGRYCGSEKPPAITSTGNILTIQFVTDSSSSKDGFSLAFTFIDVEKSCGGNFFAASGTIRSPGWPKNYLSNKACEWVITVPAGQQIMLLVYTFKMEKHRSCRFDGLTIRNGGTQNSPLIGNYCGDDNFNGTISFTNQLFLRFYSDSSRNYAGFNIEWDSAATGCGGVLTSARGSIISPNYPLPYGQNALCVWRISVSEGSAIHIVFTDMDMENHKDCMYDYLDIYDGSDMGGRKLGRFCSAETDPIVLDTDTNHAFIRMRTDETNQRRGFQLKYNILCRRNITGYGGVIESPNFPHEYAGSMDCRWTIRVPLGNKINLEFSHFDVESMTQQTATNATHQRCPFDYVEIHQLGSDMPRRYCADKPAPFVSKGRSIDLLFHTDASTEQMGFRAEWSINGCGGLLRKDYGTFTSPNYPSLYPKDTECHWTIKVEPGKRIDLTVEDFHMEVNDQCRYDGLFIANDANFTHQVAALCHQQEDPVHLASNGNELYVRFVSDHSFANKGFRASYRAIESPCGGKITLHQGFISSPNYPSNYPANMSCSWVIETDVSHTLQLHIKSFAVERSPNCTSDSLQVYDGTTGDDDRLLLTACGSELNVTTVSSSGREMLVKFQSNSIYEAKGFQAEFKTNCGSRIVVKQPGNIQLNKAHKMSSENCTWVLVAPEPTQRITLTIAHLSVEDAEGDCFASVMIYDGDSTDGPTRFEGCGHKIPPAIVSRGNALTVLITSEDVLLNKIDNLYVEFTYTTLDNACGGSLTALMGEFSTPNYPDTYPLNVECVWKLSASPGNKMTLSFKELDIEPTDDCNGDYLEVRERDANGPLLGDFCGNQIPTNLTEASSFWIKFRSNGAGVSKGFLAEYAYDVLSEITGTSGTITSPMYPRSYGRSDNIGWRITVDIGSVIAINFNRFAIDRHTDEPEMCDGALAIFDGYDETAAPLLSGCGYIKPAPVTSTSNVVYIVLDHSDIMESSLFSLNWQRKTVADTPTYTVDNESFCNGHATIVLNSTDATFNLTSPGYPTGYTSGLNCSWIFQSALPAYHPYLSFSFIDLEETSDCLADYVEVFSSPDLLSWKSFGRVCTYAIRGTYKFHGTPHLKVEFRTDYYQNRTGFTGTALLSCGGLLTDPNGVITQPDAMPSVEPGTPHARLASFESCSWNISVRPGRTIEFAFEMLNITTETTATPLGRNGFVAVLNGIDEHSPLLGRYSGVELPDKIRTGSNRGFVQYRPSIRGPNLFRLVYREVSDECGGNIVLSARLNTTDITTPHYPEVPLPHSECYWTVLAPAGELIWVEFIGLVMLPRYPHCEKEYVQLREGLTSNAPELLHTCKGDTSKRTMASTNAIAVKYFNDVNDPNGGVKVRVSLAKCGGIVRGTRGSITSNNYPKLGGYPVPAVCEYYIQQGMYGTVILTFEDINLPAKANCSGGDHVRIVSLLPGNNRTELELGKFCGTQIPTQPIVSVLPYVKVVFTATSPNPTYSGFKLNYAFNYTRCSHTVVGNAGELTSPGYGEALQTYSFCEWRITVPEGRRVKVEFIDLDIHEDPAQPWLQRLTFYDGFNYQARIKLITSIDKASTLYSSDNRMMLQYLSRKSSGSRGFRLRYSSDEPTICDGNLDGWQGSITSPANVSTIVCSYKRTQPSLSRDPSSEPNVGTLAMNFREVYSGPVDRLCVSIVRTATVAGGPNTIQKLCTNATNVMVLSPFPDTTINIVQSPFFSKLGFKMDYRVQQCGGVYGSISNISRPLGLDLLDHDGLHCAWYVTYPDQTLINIAFERFQMQQPCEQEYLLVYNGPSPMSPLIGRYCKDTPPLAEPITTQKHLLFVEYHTARPNATDSVGDFNLLLSSKNFGCGGTLHAGTPTFGSPLKDGKYRPNQECVWLLQAYAGQHIGARFINRFNLEKSTNCTKDYVELFDQRRNREWVSLGRVCGKDVPPNFNSSGTVMKVVFRTDETGEADGFTIKWESNCGGIFYAEPETNVIVSPNYPAKYNNMQVCNYTILANSTDAGVVINFLDFELEDTLVSSVCAYDNLTVYRKLQFAEPITWEKVGTYCRNVPPARFRVKDRAAIVFRTDRFIQARGFRFEYSLDTCGSNITSSMRIQSPEQLPQDATYGPALTCRWYISIPQGQKVTVRFETLEIEHTESCYFDTVEVYRGLEANHDNRLALLCGNLTKHAPAISISDSRHGMISFKTESFSSIRGKMSALILYTPDCDKHITLDERSPSYRLNVIGSGNNHVQDCQYVIQAPNGYTLRVVFDQFHVGSSRNASVANCTDDYVELRDGGSVFSQLMGRFCGNDRVNPQTSFSSTLHFRYVTDSALRGTLFDATITMIPSLCGQMHHNLTGGAIVTLNTPNFGGSNKYPPNSKCLWLLEASAGKTVEIQFLQMDLQQYDETNRECKDYVGIRDASLKAVIYEGLGNSLIFNGGGASKASFYHGSRYATAYHIYCGNNYVPSTYVSIVNRVYVSFESDGSIEGKGVSLRVHESNLCAKNYTELQGRIVQNEMLKDQRCTVTVQVPRNYTIALYFNTFYLYNVDCAVHALKLYSGPEESAEQLLGEYCNFATPNPIFTPGNFLRIVFPATDRDFISLQLDATYVATDRGQGCGGELYNYGGVFSSPLYPANNRTRMMCLWTVTVPNNLVVALQFTVFDLGSKSSCATDYLEILDRNEQPNADEASTEKDKVVRQHCGGDKPANYISTGSTVRVRYRKTQNFAGVGWMIKFMGVEKGVTVNEY
ncbi:cubilin homolog [Anopheles marshallii]|uniref:cubilin homolog n=1 Tax=Anopheles marshallii TaxID=1521116 RepID=UPI00237B46D8|nr:cubilin homolog [Anopheles marshallii]